MLELGRVPKLEYDDKSSDEVMFSNLRRLRKILEQLNPTIIFWVSFDKENNPQLVCAAPEVEFPDKWE